MDLWTLTFRFKQDQADPCQGYYQSDLSHTIEVLVAGETPLQKVFLSCCESNGKSDLLS